MEVHLQDQHEIGQLGQKEEGLGLKLLGGM